MILLLLAFFCLLQSTIWRYNNLLKRITILWDSTLFLRFVIIFFFVFFFCCRRRRLVCMYFICSTRTYRMFLFVFILHISSVCVAFYVTSLVLLFNELISSIWIRLCALCMYECDCFFFVCAFVSSLVPNKKVAQKKCSINYLCSMLAFCIAFFSSVFIQSH